MKNFILLVSILFCLSLFAGDPANDPVTSALLMDRGVPIANIVQGDGRGALRVICTNCSGGGGGSDVNIHDSSGNSITAVSGKLQVDAFQGTSPWVISAASLPLPTGASTSALQLTGNSSLSSIDSKLTSPLAVSQSGTWTTGRTWTLSSGSDSVSASVSNFPALTDVNLIQLSGAVLSVTNWMPTRISNGVSYVDPTQIRALTSSDQITIANPTLAVTQSTSPWVTSRTWSLSSGTDSVAVSNFPASTSVTQGTSPWVISGTVTANAGTDLNTSALALAVTQTDRTQKTQLTDGVRDGSIKAASTAALAADTSLVVALSPNSPLPSGSNIIGALSANQSVNLTQVGGSSLALGQTLMASSLPVTVASNQTAIPVSGPLTDTQLRATPVPVSGTVTSNQGTSPWVTSVSNFPATTAVTQSTSPWVISGTVTANAGTNLNTSALALSATQTDRTQFTKLTDGTRDGIFKAASTAAVAADPSLVVAISPNTSLPTGSNVIGALTANQSVNVAQMNGVTVSMGSGVTGTGVQRVVLPTDQTAIPAPNISSATLTNVTNSASSVSILASNANRKGVVLVNDSNTTCYYAFSGTATTSAYTFQLGKNETYFMDPPIYTGAISEICSAANGSTRVTEL